MRHLILFLGTSAPHHYGAIKKTDPMSRFMTRVASGEFDFGKEDELPFLLFDHQIEAHHLIMECANRWRMPI